MSKQNELSIERKIELEEIVAKSNLETTNIHKLLLTHQYDLSSFKYLLEALYMPINAITAHIHVYDTSSPKIDELVFVSELSQFYRVSEKDFINRIKDVRAINEFKIHSQSMMDKKRTKK